MCAKQFKDTDECSSSSVQIKVHRRHRHQELFFSAHIKPLIDYASVVWGGCSAVLKKRLNSLPHRRAVKLVFPDTTLTTDQKLDENNEPTKTTGI